MQELKGEMVGEFRIGVIPTIAPYLLPLFLTDFADCFPKVQILMKEMTTEQIRQELKIRSLDIGILALPLEDKDLEESELYLEPFLLYDCTEEGNDCRVSIDRLDYSKLCLLQEGHCLHTQVRRICEISDQFAKRDINFEFQSGSMDSLLRITETRKGITVVPYMATKGLKEEERKRIVEFEYPVPVRKVGMVTNKFFVKRMLLECLREIITNSVSRIIPQTDAHEVLKPL